MLCGFDSKFHKFSSSVKISENRLRFDKVTESLKVGTFFETLYIYFIAAVCSVQNVLSLLHVLVEYDFLLRDAC